MKYINLKIILNIFLLIIFALSAFSLSPFTDNSLIGPDVVCAAGETNRLSGTGVSCITNFAACSNSDYTNLLQNLDSITTFGDIDPTALRTSIEATYGTNVNNICIRKDLNNFIPVLESSAGYTNGRDGSGNQLNSINYTTAVRDSVVTIVKACPANWEPQQAPFAITGWGRTWGCCPVTHKFVNQKSQSNPLAYQQGICCKVAPGQPTPTFWKVDQAVISIGGVGRTDRGCAYDGPDGETVLWAPTAAFGSVEEINNAVASNDPRANYIQSISNGTNPQLGLGLGVNFLNPDGGRVYNETNISGANSLCPSNSVCAMDTTGRVVRAEDLETNAALQCDRCYSDGEAIRISEDGNALVRCSRESADAAGQPIEEIGLCNNSASDTLACLSGGSSDNENYSLCCSCRIRGGVWTGIGCTDTTPLGIITGLIRIVFGVVGGVALLQLIIAGIMYQTGDEARIKSARESIIKTLTGLAVLVFSILILRIIGINILDVLPVGSI